MPCNPVRLTVRGAGDDAGIGSHVGALDEEEGGIQPPPVIVRSLAAAEELRGDRIQRTARRVVDDDEFFLFDGVLERLAAKLRATEVARRPELDARNINTLRRRRRCARSIIGISTVSHHHAASIGAIGRQPSPTRVRVNLPVSHTFRPRVVGEPAEVSAERRVEHLHLVDAVEATRLHHKLDVEHHTVPLKHDGDVLAYGIDFKAREYSPEVPKWTTQTAT